MNNPNPFLPHSSFLEQKNKAGKRMKLAVLFSISLGVMALMALLIQGCRKPNDTADNTGTDTNATPSLPAPDLGSNTAMTPPPVDTNPVVQTPPPAPLPPAPIAPPVAQAEDYTVIKGDTFASIAKKSGVTTKSIQDANPGVDARRLKIGQKLHLPATSSAPNVSATPGMTPMADANAGGEQTYKVKSGDTLTSIAKHFHVTVKAIESANNLNTTRITVGKVLKVPGSAAPAPAPVPPAEMTPPPVAPVTTSAPAPASPMPAH
jgi:LysM repeat protein